MVKLASEAWVNDTLTRFQERRVAWLAELREQHPDVDCLHCLDSGPCSQCERGRTAEHARQRDEVERWIASVPGAIGIPTRFRSLSFASYPGPRQIVDALLGWVADAGRESVVLIGGFGRGKTALIAAALHAVVLQHAEANGLNETGTGPHQLRAERIGQFVTLAGLLESLRPGGDADWSLRRYQRVPYLAIDDLGAERLTDWGADRLFEVVNHRHNELLPTLFTSNLTLNDLGERINRQVAKSTGMRDESGDRIVNRLIESCQVIQFAPNAPNLRLRGR